MDNILTMPIEMQKELLQRTIEMEQAELDKELAKRPVSSQNKLYIYDLSMLINVNTQRLQGM